LANGSSFWVTIRFGQLTPGGSGKDIGAQWIMADPKPFDTFPTRPGTTQLESGRFQKRHLYANGGEDWSYNCFVENSFSPGWKATFFTLSGGGNA
jgi:hypothetical protein